jgi:glutathione S-transferase
VKLFQIPFSHNSVKVRRALELKGLEYESEHVNPVFRGPVRRVSGQWLAPVLVDGDRVIADSTAILLYLEEAYPEPSLLPTEPAERAECLVLEDWADATFMALSRRLAYWRFLTSGASLGDLFFPGAPKLVRRLSSPPGSFALRRRFGLSAQRYRLDEAEARRAAELAAGRLGGRDFLVGDRVSIADVALAAMSAPLELAPLPVREYPAVRTLVSWALKTLGVESYPVDTSLLQTG